MRFTNVGLVLGFGCISALSAMAAGCGGGGETGSGGAGGSSSTSVSVSASTSVSSSASGAVSCVPTDPICTKVPSGCVALSENKGLDKFALRMSHLSVEKPASLSSPQIKPFIGSGVVLNLDKCKIDGNGTFNLLMQFDAMAKTLTIGGAKPVTDPTKGYAFSTGMVKGIDISPVVVEAAVGADGAFAQAKGADIVLPIYLSPADELPSVLLPIHQAKITGTLTDSNNCIGKFDPTLLQKGCTKAVDAYTDAADLDGHITLEQADTVDVDALGLSLCVLLSGDPATYGDTSTPKKCKRTAGKIDFQGDWCTATDDATCTDSVKLTGKLAASSVLLNP